MPMNICSSLDGPVDLFDIVFTSLCNARSEVAADCEIPLGEPRHLRIQNFEIFGRRSTVRLVPV